MRLLHISGGAVAVAGGIILAFLAIRMVVRPGKKVVKEIVVREDPEQNRDLPTGLPYLLNPVGITTLFVASGEVVSIGSAGLVLGLVLLVGAFDYLVFANIDQLAKR